MADKQQVITDLANAADELHRSAAGHPNVVKAIEDAITFMNAGDVPEPKPSIEPSKPKAVADTPPAKTTVGASQAEYVPIV